MKQLVNRAWQHLKKVLGCRLCRRIAVGVFLAILVVEAGILFFSIRNYEMDRLAEVEREAVVVMRAILRSASIQGSLANRFSETGTLLRDGSVLLGAIVHSPSGIEIARFGEKPELSVDKSNGADKTIRRRLHDNTRMDIVWPPNRVRGPYRVSARIDTSEIHGQIVDFIWRIAGLVLLISVFVTIVTILVLDQMVMSPIIKLGNRLTATGADPNNPEKYIVQTTRDDEWGEVIRAFNQMLRWSGSNLANIRNKERELRGAKEDAEQANIAKSVFLSSMSHELRTPLNAVLGFGQLLENNPREPLSKKQKGHVASILAGGRHLLGLINEILDLASIEAGKLEISVQDVTPGTILIESIPLIEGMASKRGIDITIGDKFKNAAKIRADPVRFKQSLLNLLSNAVKYNRDQGTIVVDCAPTTDGKLRFSVTDTGKGIPDGSLKQLFEPFNRLDAVNSKIEGAGVGLTITKRLIEKMDGRVGVDSEVGSGSTFWIELPLA